MTSGSVLRRKGFAPDARVVLLHIDDVGMCHATVEAYRELLAHVPPLSASFMAPCPWFGAAADLAREAKACAGLHMTLTSEWSTYRWRPLSTVDPASGLLDEHGFFPSTVAALKAKASVLAVEKELTAQVDQARQRGLPLSHFDSHMFALHDVPAYWSAYVGLVQRHELPILVERMEREKLLGWGVDPEAADWTIAQFAALENAGVPLVEARLLSPLQDVGDRAAHVASTIENAPPGLSYFIFHPAVDSAELRSICSDWQARVGDYEVLRSGLPWEIAKKTNVHIVTFRDLR